VAKGKYPGAKIPHGRVYFKVGDLVRITKEKLSFLKHIKKTFSTEIIRVVKVIQRVRQPVYQLCHAGSAYGRPVSQL